MNRLTAIDGVGRSDRPDGSVSLAVRGLEFARVCGDELLFGFDRRHAAGSEAHIAEAERIAHELARLRNSDAIDLNTRTLNVEVDVDNRTGRLFPGAYAFIHLKVPASAGAVTIPSNALLFRSEGLRAGVVRNGHVALTPITIGQDYGNAVEVLSGLSTGDEVIVNPSDSLAEGSAVRVRAKSGDTVRR